MPWGCILNCFGIQPIFVNDGKIDQSFLGFMYRMGTGDHKTGTVEKIIKYRLGKQNDEILKNCFHVKNANEVVVKTLLHDRTFTFKQNASLNELLKDENHAKLKEIILTHFERIRYYTMMCQGNFIITSQQQLYYKSLFIRSEVANYTCYLVDEKILPKNILILGHSPSTSFRSPYVMCPLIDKKHFDEVCKMNNIGLNSFDELNLKKKYPLIQKHLNLYSLYQSYLDNVEVPYWYMETFKNPPKSRQKAFYTTLYFD